MSVSTTFVILIMLVSAVHTSERGSASEEGNINSTTAAVDLKALVGDQKQAINIAERNPSVDYRDGYCGNTLLLSSFPNHRTTISAWSRDYYPGRRTVAPLHRCAVTMVAGSAGGLFYFTKQSHFIHDCSVQLNLYSSDSLSDPYKNLLKSIQCYKFYLTGAKFASQHKYLTAELVNPRNSRNFYFEIHVADKSAPNPATGDTDLSMTQQDKNCNHQNILELADFHDGEVIISAWDSNANNQTPNPGGCSMTFASYSWGVEFYFVSPAPHYIHDCSVILNIYSSSTGSDLHQTLMKSFQCGEFYPGQTHYATHHKYLTVELVNPNNSTNFEFQVHVSNFEGLLLSEEIIIIVTSCLVGILLLCGVCVACSRSKTSQKEQKQPLVTSEKSKTTTKSRSTSTSHVVKVYGTLTTAKEES